MCKKLAHLFVLSIVLCSCRGMDRYAGTGSTRSTSAVATDVTDSGVGQCAGEVSTVQVKHWTGPIPSPWSEEFIISETSVRLTRTGNQVDNINTGTWEFAVDPERVALLFARLKGVDWASIEAIPPEESLDGGGSTSYVVTCEGENSPSLWYRPGWAYTGGEAVTKPIEAFISGLTLPPEAFRYIEGDSADGREKEKTDP